MSMKACVIYVAETQARLAGVVERLKAQGYEVCEVSADLPTAQITAAGASELPAEIRACIDGADLCVILLPSEPDCDDAIGEAAAYADQQQRRMVCIVEGARIAYPEAIMDVGKCVVRADSPRLDDAIRGDDFWEGPDGKPAPERPYTVVKCQ